MTEVARSLVPAGHGITSIRQYEAAPPLGAELVQPGDTVATTKEEEWISKKKTEVTNTKQIETRVKRQVVLEDGKVVEDSGPVVTTNTTEDVDTQEHHQTELRKLGDDGVDGGALVGAQNYDGVLLEGTNSTGLVANPDGLVREVSERKVVSREETEELKETEDVQHLGDITDEDFVAAVQSGHPDLRRALRPRDGVVATGPRLLVDTRRSRKTVDTEETRQSSRARDDGGIVTETVRTAEHEVIDDRELPDDEPDRNYSKESSQRYLKTKDQEEVDYVANGVNVGHEMRFKTETMEAERRGDFDEPDLFESLSARARKRGNNRQPYRQRGITDWSPPPGTRPYAGHSPGPYAAHDRTRRSPSPDYRSPAADYRHRNRSPAPDYAPDYAGRRTEDVATPTPPRRTKNERPRQRFVDERSNRLESSEYRSSSRRDDERNGAVDVAEPPPDYSPPSPPPNAARKQVQKTRFAVESSPKPQKTGNIIGQSIRKLVGKIRSASAERKARQRAKRSPSPPTYQPGHVIDGNIERRGGGVERLDGAMHQADRSTPVQRYYLGEDPFGGSIFGRENKYEGARRQAPRRPDDRRSQSQTSTLGRFSKSTSRLSNGHQQHHQQHHHHHQQQQQQQRRSSQTLPRHLNTINVSIINTVSSPRQPEGPAKPQRTYKSNLSRSKSLNVPGGMYASHPQLSQPPLKSPGLISSLNRSRTAEPYAHRFARTSDNKTAFLSSLKDRAPELFKTLEGGAFEYEHEPPTRLRDGGRAAGGLQEGCRRGSASSGDFSEVYRATTRSEDPANPCVTDTVRRFSRRTAPSPTGRGVETVEATETKVTRSGGRYAAPIRAYEAADRWYNGGGSKPVVIEVRNYK